MYALPYYSRRWGTPVSDIVASAKEGANKDIAKEGGAKLGGVGKGSIRKSVNLKKNPKKGGKELAAQARPDQRQGRARRKTRGTIPLTRATQSCRAVASFLATFLEWVANHPLIWMWAYYVVALVTTSLVIVPTSLLIFATDFTCQAL